MKLLITTQTVDKNDPILGFFHSWVIEFGKRFDHVDVICLKEGEHDLPDHIYVHSLGKEGGENRFKYVYRFYTYLWRLYMKEHTDVVFFHMGAVLNILAAPFFILRKVRKTKFLWWKAHGKINFLGRLALVFTDEVITSTKSGFPIDTKKRRVVGQAIDTSLFTLPDASLRDIKQIVFVGRIMPIKCLEVYIEVAKVLKKEGYSFSIIGPVGDEKYYAQLLELSKGSGAEFLGSKTQSELVEAYQKAGYFINTSLTHSMDKTVLEAMLCGCIPLTANKAFEGLLSPFNLYFEKQDAKAYSERVLKGDDESVRSRIRQLVVEHYSLDTFAQRIFNI